MERYVDRILRAAQLDVQLYEEVEADQEAFWEALGVVVLSSLAAGLGRVSGYGLSALFLGTIAALVGWFIWAYLTYYIGTKLLPEPQTESDFGELLRTIGFSSAPGLLRILGFVPVLGGIIVIGASIWMLVAMVIAVRQALDYESTGRAIGVCVIGWLIQAAIMVMLVGVRTSLAG